MDQCAYPKVLYLRPKAVKALKKGGEEKLEERTVSILWDPISRSVVTHRIEVLAPREMKGDLRPKVVPRETGMPAPHDLPATDLQALRIRTAERGEQSSALRCVELRRPTLRYRHGVVLVYGGNKGAVPVVRVALDGALDQVYSSAAGS